MNIFLCCKGKNSKAKQSRNNRDKKAKVVTILLLLIALFAMLFFIKALESDLIFHTYGGEEIDSVKITTEYVLPDNPIKLGHTFQGWFLDENFNEAASNKILPTGKAINVYAKWEVNTYTLSFNTLGGNTINALTLDYNTDITLPENPIRVGYTFGGWFNEESLSTPFSLTMPAEDITIYAKWIINTYNLSFITDGGTLIPTLSFNYNENILLPNNPTLNGFTFGGWFNEESLSTPFILTKMPAETITIYAKWIKLYTVTFLDWDDTVLSIQIINHGLDATAPADPYRPSTAENTYIFIGWDLDFDYITCDLTVAAQYDEIPNPFTISFDSDGGDNVDPITQAYGTAVSPPIAPLKTGYLFAGWYENEELTIFYEFTTMPAANITLYADWGTNGLSYTLINGNTEYSVSAGSASNKDIIRIPNRHQEKPVIEISNSGFFNCNLTSIIISNNVRVIDDWAFAYCDNLEVVIFVDNSLLTSIGDCAFFQSSLESINIPNGLISIGASSFANCYNLTIINLGSEMASIGYVPFYRCSSLTEINVSEYNDNYISLDGVLFNKALTELIQYPIGNSRNSYTVPDSVINIGMSAFVDCTILTTLIIGENSQLISIDNYAFYGCINLTTITFGDNSQLISIGNGAFWNCFNLQSIEISDSITSIGEMTFYSCLSLTTITFKENSQLFSIGKSAFGRCVSLESIIIPNSVTSIEGEAFFHCASLESIIISNNVTYLGDRVFILCSNLTIYTSFSSQPIGWDSLWNPDNRPVVWESILSEHYSYVVSIDKSNIDNPDSHTLNNPYREGYIFDGWYISDDSSGVKYDTLADAPAVVLYARWEEE